MGSRLRVFVHGRVQGVGFRYSTAAKAQALGLRGWVRNLADGSVEALFEGSRDTLEEVLVWCEQGPPLAKVERVEVAWESAPAQYNRFDLKVDG